MKNRYFSSEMLDILLWPEQWTIFGPYCPPPRPTVSAPDHDEWMAKHSHQHDHLEVMMVLRGRGCHGYGGEVYEFWPGTVFCFAPQERHDVEMPPWAPEADVLWVNVTGRSFTARLLSFRQTAKGSRDTLGHLLMIEDTGLLGPNPLLYLDFIKESREPVRPLQVRAGVELLLAAVVADGYEEDWVRPESRARRAVRLIEEYIQEVGGRTTLDDCARLAGYSRSHFSRLFTHFAREYIKDYIDDYRFAHSNDLLRDGWTYKHIAEHYDMSPQSFCRWYRRHERSRPF